MSTSTGTGRDPGGEAMSWRLDSNHESDGVSLSCWQSLDRKIFQWKGTSFQTMERWKRNPGK